MADAKISALGAASALAGTEPLPIVQGGVTVKALVQAVADLMRIRVNPQTGTTYTVLTTDRGYLITHNNSGSIAVTIPQATGSFANFYFWYQNTGAGTVTLTPTTSTIDGAASLALTTNQGCLIVSDGTNWKTERGVGSASSSSGGGFSHGQEFVASGNFTVPTGVTAVCLHMIGGGGAGSSTITAALGGGGGGSGELIQNFPVVVVAGNTYAVNIGAGGIAPASGQASAQAGGTGGDTSFAALYYARGGAGGATSGNSGAGGGMNGGAAKAIGNPAVAGAPGTQESPTAFGGGSGGSGGNTVAGAAGAAAGGYPTGAAGGVLASARGGGGGGANTIYGLGGAGGSGGSAGSAAASTSYGAGGGGGSGQVTTTTGGGNGAPGYCLITWVA